MSRARATALGLVNWKGVFYERYLLDRHVTALEGANGAGKTTVMIAAYVVLLPDLSRLRFTNVGESGATGGDKGIWGRLGDIGRPSYAAMELTLAGGERVIAGVHLERKAEPALELTPFVVTGLDLSGSLREILLLSDGEHEAVPVLSDVREAVASRGGKMDVFATAKDYFAALFERGITALRMATDEDRNKLNELLRTSMTGGISRALTTELRAFLFKEETGLEGALSRMRGNLDACHRTRIEVSEARRLEREISGIHDAGQAMFAAVMMATRAECEERGRLTESARAAHDEAQRSLGALEEDFKASAARYEGSVARLEDARAAEASAEARSEVASRAHALTLRLADLEPELDRAREAARTAFAVQEEAARRRETRQRELETSRDAYERAARGLADLQSGLDELHRRAHAYRSAHRHLDEARAALETPLLDEHAIDASLTAVAARLEELDIARARLDRDVQSTAVRKHEHARAMAALGELVADVDPMLAHEQARRALAQSAELGVRAGRIAELTAARERALLLAARQVPARARAAELGVAVVEGSAALTVQEQLAAADEEVRAADSLSRAEETRATEARRARDEALRLIAVLEAGVARWRDASAIAVRLESALELPVRSRTDLAAARTQIERRRDASRARAVILNEQRDALMREGAALEASLGAVHPDLLRLRDELDAELLAARFEDLDEEEAARVQARLGPLVDALVVADPASAARKLAGRPRDIETVWLVASGAPIGEDKSDETDVVIAEAHGLRVTRTPSLPALGRRARGLRAADRRAEAERVRVEGEAVELTLRTLEDLGRDADRLVELIGALESGDPSDAIQEARAEVRAAEATMEVSSRAAATATQRRLCGLPRVDALRAMLAEAFLLEPPDHEALARELAEELRVATAAREELHRVEPARRVLSELVEALRSPVDDALDGDASARLSADRARLDGERERLFRAREALDAVCRGRHALAFADAEQALQEGARVAPALEEQLARAKDAVGRDDRALRAAESVWEAATRASQKAEAEHEATLAHVARVRSERAALGDVAAGADALAAVVGAARARQAERVLLERDERTLATHIALLRERASHAARNVEMAARRIASEESAANPAAERWASAERAREAAQIRPLSTCVAEAYAGRPSATLWPEVRSRGEVLLDRLRGARGGAECLPAVEAALEASADRMIDLHVKAFCTVGDWVKRRLPAHVADVADPLDGVGRLRIELGRLEEHLVRHESDLRGISEDVARGIEVQLRRAKNQVRRLNQNLDGVRFGSIAGIRVQMRRIERMDQILRALREGAAQELLFQPNLPIEEALDEIFRRFGGAKRGGSARILDYREYVELAVEIKRQADGDWEAASATRLSTGEAIGVGAALMMVILTEWERDADLLRPKRSSGSLRFLFLDEANRLSQDNLGVLFDLCKTLDLQLLIAAPEVARAEGNTTYRLVRSLSAEGREEVLVSGRRTVAEV